MASIIVPAHNEATVIQDCLDSLIHQAGVSTLIVACNGCTDNTADLVRQHYPQVICLDIAQPSKVNALNEAEQYIQDWPVFYIDADTRLSLGAIERISSAMSDNKLLLSAPEPSIDTCHSSWWVKQYYRIWIKLPYIRDGVVATCSFVLSQAGRQRFERFPEVINDDGFVRCQFTSAERGNVPNTQIHIQAPRDLYSLVKIKTRARLGNMQLAQAQLCSQPEQKPYSNIMLSRLLSRDFIPACVYIGIALWIRIRAKRQFKHISSYRWESDQSSRQHRTT